MFLWGIEDKVLVADEATHEQIPLDSTNYPVWAGTAYLPPDTTFKYSYIRKGSNGTVSHFACVCSPCSMELRAEIMEWMGH